MSERKKQIEFKKAFKELGGIKVAKDKVEKKKETHAQRTGRVYREVKSKGYTGDLKFPPTKDRLQAWEEFLIQSSKQKTQQRRQAQKEYQEAVKELGRIEEAKPKFRLLNFSEKSRKTTRKYGTEEITYEMKISSAISKLNFLDIYDEFYKALEIKIKRVVDEQKLTDDDRIMLKLIDPTQNNLVVSTSLIRVGDLSVSILFDKISKLLNSDIPFSDSSYISIITTLQPRGSGRNQKITNISSDLKKKKGVVLVNTQEGCFWQCMALGSAQISKKLQGELDRNNKAWERLTKFKDKEKYRHKEAYKIFENTKEDYPSIEFKEVKYEDYNKIEIKFNIGINIYDLEKGKFIYPPLPKKKVYTSNIYMLYSFNHYDYLTTPNILFGSDGFCTKCMVGFINKAHSCIQKCKACQSDKCEGAFFLKDRYKPHNDLLKNYFNEDITSKIYSFIGFDKHCVLCNQDFYDENCLRRHEGRICKANNYCEKCESLYKRMKDEEHKCGWEECDNCKEYVELKFHKCYIQSKKPKNKTDKIIVWDIEADINYENGHKPICIVAEYVYGRPTIRRTDKEGNERIENIPFGIFQSCYDEEYSCFVFKNIDQFGNFCLSHLNEGYTFIAHNGGKYDLTFLRKFLLDRSIRIRKQCSRGNNIISMELGGGYNVRFIDSLNFISQPLSEFPKTFGIQELKKGYFPYKFITETNLHTKYDKHPDIYYYEPNNFKSKKYDDFMRWYKDNSNKPFDTWNELVKYCVSDVKLLKEGWRTFRELFLQITDDQFDPTSYITIAQFCMALYRFKFMPHDTIGILKNDFEINQSMISKEWLAYVERRSRPADEDLGRASERAVGEQRSDIKLDREVKLGCWNGCVDAFDEKSNTIYQFDGCYFHGCLDCYTENTINTLNQKTMKTLHYQTKRRNKALLEKGYNLVVMKEHEWNELKKSDKQVKSFMDTFNNTDNEPLKLTEAFFGGNTQATKFYVKAEEDECIEYDDFNSLYPSVNRCKFNDLFEKDIVHSHIYPIGHPDRIEPREISKDDLYVSSLGRKIFGFVKCKVIPNRKLYHPILPKRMEDSDKLLFQLEPFVGSFFTEELKYAMKYGYNIEKIYDAYDFPMSINEPETASNLFTDYVKTFLKIKQESSGIPEFCKTDEDINNYINEYRLKEGIELDRTNLKRNEGLRYISKLCLNSLWGKFGQNSNLTNYETLTNNPSKFFELVFSGKYEVQDYSIVSEDTIDISYKKKSPFIKNPKTTNIAIACATTSYARIRLQSVLQHLGENVIYMDTDSIIYKRKRNETNPLIRSEFLGDLKSELKNGDYITEFVSTGPKSYAYKTKNGKTECKIKGFTLSVANSKNLNLESLKHYCKNFAMHNEQKPITTTNLKFQINRLNRSVNTFTETKLFSMVCDKREIVMTDNIIDSIPFGYSQ